MAAFQILSKDCRWQWVKLKHIDSALVSVQSATKLVGLHACLCTGAQVVDTGDALDFPTGGYYKGAIHRVVQPPPDQQQHTRLGPLAFYFVGPNDHTKLSMMPIRESRGYKELEAIRSGRIASRRSWSNGGKEEACMV